LVALVRCFFGPDWPTQTPNFSASRFTPMWRNTDSKRIRARCQEKVPCR
jgi:hypothetical protein